MCVGKVRSGGTLNLLLGRCSWTDVDVLYEDAELYNITNSRSDAPTVDNSIAMTSSRRSSFSTSRRRAAPAGSHVTCIAEAIPEVALTMRAHRGRRQTLIGRDMIAWLQSDVEGLNSRELAVAYANGLLHSGYLTSSTPGGGARFSEDAIYEIVE